MSELAAEANENVTVVEKTSRLLNYLSAVAREVGPEPMRDVTTQDFTLWPSEIPDHVGVSLGPSAERAAWLTIRKVPLPAPPVLPEDLKDLIDPRSVESPGASPSLLRPNVLATIQETLEQEEPAWRDAEGKKWDAANTDADERDQVEGNRFPESDVTSVGEWEQDQRRANAIDTEVARLRNERTRQIETSIAERLEFWKVTTWQEWVSRVSPAFAARVLYARLFELRMRLESDSATIELVWGHCPFVYNSPGGKRINAPLVCATSAIEISEADGTIRVLPETSPQIDLSALEGAEVHGLDSLQTLQARVRQDPIEIWNESERATLQEQLIAPLGVDATIARSRDPLIPSLSPVLGDGWVLYVRKRPLRQEAFYKLLSEKIEHDEIVPESLASIVTDSDSVDRAVIASGSQLRRDDGSADRLLMPLPANDDQMRIARQLAGSRGVTVQGPPGTGKSHTIVNLLSHLVAQGKRVLITAQNEQALTVVREKIPPEIRDLSLAVLGSTPAALEEMRDSAQSMRDSLSQVDTVNGPRRLSEFGEQIDELREEARRNDLQLIEALRSEQREFPLSTGNSRAVDVAKWLTANEELRFIPDRPSLDQRLPLTTEQIRQLQQLSNSISHEDAERALQGLPLDEWVLTSTQLEDLQSESTRVGAEIDELVQAGLRIDVISTWTDADLFALAARLEQQSMIRSELSGEWEDRFSQELKGSTALAHWIASQNHMLASRIEAVRHTSDLLIGQEILVPDTDPTLLQQQLLVWKSRLETGKKLPVIGAKGLKALAQEVRVSGFAVTSPTQVNYVMHFVHLRASERELARTMQDIYSQIGAPVPQPGPGFVLAAMSIQQRIQRLSDWWLHEYPPLTAALAQLIVEPDQAADIDRMRRARALLGGVSQQRKAQQIEQDLISLRSRIAEQSKIGSNSSLWRELLTAFDKRDYSLWNESLSEAQRLGRIRQQVQQRDELHLALSRGGSPRWADSILESSGSAEIVGRIDLIPEAWIAAQAQKWLSDLHLSADVEHLMGRARGISGELQKHVIQFASLSARLKLKVQMKDPQRRAMETWLTAIKKVGKGTGKTAPRFQAQAREALPEAMGAVPVWIMPIYRVLENFDPTVSEMFDVVIVDESSQCDLLSLGVLALGKKSVVVGDDKQTSPAAVGVVTSRIFELQNQYVRDFPDRSLLTMDESLYSISSRAYPSTILLREHFRCVPEIIRFSNRFYGDRILPLREMTVPAIGSPLNVVHVEEGAAVSRGAQKVNRREAQALVEKVAECARDPRYDGLTFGVVTMMSGPQADIIEAMLMEELGIDVFESRKLRVGNPPKFQGDERNVIFISFVADDNSFAATRETNAQWANVAASRAQDQLWLFHTMDPTTLNPNDYRRALIEFASDPGATERADDLFAMTDSKFEEDVLRELLERGYDVQPQYRVGAYRIDMVVQVGPGERLAIECDGDAFHGPEHWENDVRRQRVLERLGWSFWRVRASEFYLDRDESLQSLWDRLESMKMRMSDRASIALKQRENASRQHSVAAAEEDVPDDVEATEPLERPTTPPGPADPLSLSVAEGEKIAEGTFAQLGAESDVNGTDGSGDSGPITLTDARKSSRERRVEAKIHELEQAHGGAASQRRAGNQLRGLSEVSPQTIRASKEDNDSRQPSVTEVREAWKSGQRFRLSADGTITRVGSETTLEELIGARAAATLAERMQALRVGGGIFKVGEFGELVTLIDGEPIFVGYVPLNDLRF